MGELERNNNEESNNLIKYQGNIKPIILDYQNNLKKTMNYFVGASRISTMAISIAEQQLLRNEKFMDAISSSVSNVIRQIAETQNQFVSTLADVMRKSIIPALNSLAISLEEAKNNPDSLLNWMHYYDKLSEFFWIMPYKITTEELHEILENAKTEKEFDKLINRYFNISKIESLTNDIGMMLPNNNQRKIFNQIVTAYKNKSYALASIGIITMIDNSLSYYLIDKGCTSRLRLFEPIINDLKLKRSNSEIYFIVMMINSNINLLYEQIEFNNKISINTNKKARRNPISHGKSYSYKRIDTIMLMNTLYYLLVIQSELKQYKNSLYKKSNKKEFYIPNKEKKREIKQKIEKKVKEIINKKQLKRKNEDKIENVAIIFENVFEEIEAITPYDLLNRAGIKRQKLLSVKM